MKRRITICSGQFGDIPLPELCRQMEAIGYEGFDLSCHAHIDINKALNSAAYRDGLLNLLSSHHMHIGALSAHLAGQCVGDQPDPRLDLFAPPQYAGMPERIREWAIDDMKNTARVAQLLHVPVVTCFMGSPLWPWWYSFPKTTQEMIADGYARIRELWTPVFDIYDECGVKLALEVHPAEIAFDYYSTCRLMEELSWRETLGLNFDPSHLLWQGVDPAVFLRDFASRIYHVHLKDVKITRDGRAGVLGSHLEFGDTRRGWNFVTLGHGHVDFDSIIRELNSIGYDGPLCVEWEDSGMERMRGAEESFRYAAQMNFRPSAFVFDDALKAK